MPNKEVEESWALEAKPPPPYDGNHRYLKSEVAHLLAENQRLRELLQPIIDCYGLGQSAEKFTEQVGPFIIEARAALSDTKAEDRHGG